MMKMSTTGASILLVVVITGLLLCSTAPTGAEAAYPSKLNFHLKKFSLPGITSPILGPISNITSPILGPITNITSPIIGGLTNVTSPILGPISNITTPIIGGVINVTSPILGPVTNFTAPIVGSVTNFTSPVVGSLNNLTTPIVGTVTNFTDPIVDSVTNLTAPIVGILMNLTSPIVGSVINLTTPIVGSVTNLTSTAITVNITDVLGLINNLTLPWQGAVVGSKKNLTFYTNVTVTVSLNLPPLPLGNTNTLPSVFTAIPNSITIVPLGVTEFSFQILALAGSNLSAIPVTFTVPVISYLGIPVSGSVSVTLDIPPGSTISIVGLTNRVTRLFFGVSWQSFPQLNSVVIANVDANSQSWPLATLAIPALI